MLKHAYLLRHVAVIVLSAALRAPCHKQACQALPQAHMSLSQAEISPLACTHAIDSRRRVLIILHTTTEPLPFYRVSFKGLVVGRSSPKAGPTRAGTGCVHETVRKEECGSGGSVC